jgi:hypothetical protein
MGHFSFALSFSLSHSLSHPLFLFRLIGLLSRSLLSGWTSFQD